MKVREFLRANMATIDAVYLDHEAGMRDGICYCRCGYRATEAEWLTHVADKIADVYEMFGSDVDLPTLFAIPGVA